MAVYTKLSEANINKILEDYQLGELIKFAGIKEGIENTNYSIETEKGKYILTIYERRVKETDLPFFSNLMVELSKNGFVCPKPLANKDNNYISDFNDKKFMIVSFLDGKSKSNLSPIGTSGAPWPPSCISCSLKLFTVLILVILLIISPFPICKVLLNSGS